MKNSGAKGAHRARRRLLATCVRMDCRYTGCLSSQDGSIPGERREKGTASVLFEPLTNVYRLYRDLVVSRSHVVSHVGAVAHGNVKECYILRMRVANFVADFLYHDSDNVCRRIYVCRIYLSTIVIQFRDHFYTLRFPLVLNTEKTLTTLLNYRRDTAHCVDDFLTISDESSKIQRAAKG